MSDLSSLLMDPDLGSAGFTLIRRLYTRNKAATDETLTEIPSNGCVFPGTPEMAQLLPAEEQGREFIKIHTTQPLSLGSGSPSGLRYRAADLIRFRNRIWKVVRVKDWSAFNFYTAYAVLQTEADAPWIPSPRIPISRIPISRIPPPDRLPMSRTEREP